MKPVLRYLKDLTDELERVPHVLQVYSLATANQSWWSTTRSKFGHFSTMLPEGEDDQFLYLPALGRSRRISSRERQDPFVGSDFTYVEILGRRLEDYTYQLLREDSLDGLPVYILASTAKDSNAKQPRSVSWVDAERFMILRSEIFDSNGELISSRIEEIPSRTPIDTTTTFCCFAKAQISLHSRRIRSGARGLRTHRCGTTASIRLRQASHVLTNARSLRRSAPSGGGAMERGSRDESITNAMRRTCAQNATLLR